MGLVYRYQEGGSITKKMVDDKKVKETLPKEKNVNSETTNVSSKKVPSLQQLKREKFEKENAKYFVEPKQETVSNARKLTDQEQATSDKIINRLNSKEKWKNTIVGDLGIDPYDIGITAGNVASKLTRLSPLTEEEIIRTTNNPKETALLSSNLFTNALANEMAGGLISKGATKLIPKAKVKTTDEVESLIKEIEDTKPIATEYKINDPNINKNNGIIDKPKDPNYLNDFGLRFVDDTKFKDTDELKILAEHGKQPKITAESFPNKREKVLDEFIDSFYDKEKINNSNNLDILLKDNNGWNFELNNYTKSLVDKHKITLDEVKNRIKKRSKLEDYISDYGSNVKKDLAKRQMNYAKYKDKLHDIDADNFAIEADDIQLTPEEIAEYKKFADKNKARILKEDLKDKYKGIDAFQGIKLNKKGGLIYK